MYQTPTLITNLLPSRRGVQLSAQSNLPLPWPCLLSCAHKNEEKNWTSALTSIAPWYHPNDHCCVRKSFLGFARFTLWYEQYCQEDDYETLLECYWQAENRSSLRKPLSHCHFVHHRHHVDWPEIESGRPSIKEWNSCQWCIEFRFLPHKEQNTSPPQRPISIANFKLCIYNANLLQLWRFEVNRIDWTRI